MHELYTWLADITHRVSWQEPTPPLIYIHLDDMPGDGIDDMPGDGTLPRHSIKSIRINSAAKTE